MQPVLSAETDGSSQINNAGKARVVFGLHALKVDNAKES